MARDLLGIVNIIQGNQNHLETFFAANGRPSIIKSENDPPFHEFAKYLKGQNIQHSRILPENPQANEV